MTTDIYARIYALAEMPSGVGADDVAHIKGCALAVAANTLVNIARKSRNYAMYLGKGRFIVGHGRERGRYFSTPEAAAAYTASQCLGTASSKMPACAAPG